MKKETSTLKWFFWIQLSKKSTIKNQMSQKNVPTEQLSKLHLVCSCVRDFSYRLLPLTLITAGCLEETDDNLLNPMSILLAWLMWMLHKFYAKELKFKSWLSPSQETVRQILLLFPAFNLIVLPVWGNGRACFPCYSSWHVQWISNDHHGWGQQTASNYLLSKFILSKFLNI